MAPKDSVLAPAVESHVVSFFLNIYPIDLIIQMSISQGALWLLLANSLPSPPSLSFPPSQVWYMPALNTANRYDRMSHTNHCTCRPAT